MQIMGWNFSAFHKKKYMSHLGIMAKYFNPRRAWAYMGEDFMQKVKKLAGGCSHGIKAHKLEPKVMRHYCTGLYFSLVNPSSWWKQWECAVQNVVNLLMVVNVHTQWDVGVPSRNMWHLFCYGHLHVLKVQSMSWRYNLCNLKATLQCMCLAIA